MARKYNIALIPKSKSDDVVKCAQNFLKISDQYQLGNNSLPHVTLCQFQAEEKEIDDIWRRVCDSLPEHSIELEFKDFSCIPFKNTFWVSIMPNQRLALDKMHQIVASTVNAPINKSYDPHMTLISTKDAEYQKKAEDVAKSYAPISDAFVLSIGECDAVGQFTKLLHKCEMRSSAACRM